MTYRRWKSHDSVIDKMASGRIGLVLVNICLLLAPVTVAEFIVTHAPKHVQFLKDPEDLRLSEIQNVISSAFGFDIEKDMSWKGLAAGSLFARPKSTILISIESPPEFHPDVRNIATYQTTPDVSEIDTDGVAYNIFNLVQKDDKPLIVDLSLESRVFEIRSAHPELFKDVPSTSDKLRQVFNEGRAVVNMADAGSLNVSREGDLNFIGELHVIGTIADALRSKGQALQGRLPNFFHFKIRGIQTLFNTYGSGSEQVSDAKRVLEHFIDQITSELRAVYTDNVLVLVVTLPRSEMSLNRKARHLLQTEAPSTGNINLAAEYSDMYPIVFNIILWFVIVMALAIYAVSYGMWYMDPGRDSIIYRMTSQRMKKD